MAKRRVKKRTHTATRNGQATSGTAASPRSMVIRTGAAEVGPSISQLAKDMRLLMEPETATRLKVRGKALSFSNETTYQSSPMPIKCADSWTNRSVDQINYVTIRQWLDPLALHTSCSSLALQPVIQAFELPNSRGVRHYTFV